MTLTFIKKQLLLVLFVCISAPFMPSCITGEPLENKTKLTKEEKMVIKFESREKKKNIAEYEAAVKAHRKNQTKATQKMMKEAKKQQHKNNRIHQRSFWDRLFGNSCNKK